MSRRARQWAGARTAKRFFLGGPREQGEEDDDYDLPDDEGQIDTRPPKEDRQHQHQERTLA